MRTKNSIMNILFSFIGQIIILIISFVERSFFVHTLSVAHMGINGLFSNILMMLSLADLGVGSAIIYSLYKPIADNEKYKIAALLNLYAKAYKIIAIVILVLGVSLTPFLDFIIKDRPDIPDLEGIYILYVLNSVVTYVFAYKRSIIIANQKAYLVSVTHCLFFALRNVVQIGILVTTKNFFLYVSLQAVFNYGENIAISLIADRLYPYLKEIRQAQVDQGTKQEIYKNVSALVLHKLSGVITNGSDNLIISSFVGVVWVGLYSNYYLIISALTGILSQVFGSLTASVGNLSAHEGQQKKYQIYKVLHFASFWVFGLCSICLWQLLNPFILLWIGKAYILDNKILAVLVLNFYIEGMRSSTLVFRDAMGLFWYDRYKPIAQALINIIASIFLAYQMGIVGVFLGTIVSKLTTAFWVEPYIVHKYGFQKSQRSYYLRYLAYSLLAGIVLLVTDFICSAVNNGTLAGFFSQCLLCLVIPNLLFGLIMARTEEFIYFTKVVKGITLTKNLSVDCK